MALQKTTVDIASAGMRLDLFVTGYLSRTLGQGGVSRAGVQKLIAAGRVTVNGEQAKPSTHIKSDDRIEIRNFPPHDASLKPEALPLTILYEDEDCVVINKAPGMVVHPAAGNASGTLVNALLHYCPDLGGIGGERRPGIVHRLDKDTSGVMIVAKNDASLQSLTRQFKDRSVHKEYLALVWGRLKGLRGIISRPIGRHRSERKRMSSTYALAKTRAAVTEWCVEKSFPVVCANAKTPIWISLLRLMPKTGRTHQIRVHLADLGYPVIGDKIYGRKRGGGMSRAIVSAKWAGFPRHALHAEKLRILHPRSAQLLEFCAPLWGDMADLLAILEAETKSVVICKTAEGLTKEAT